MTKTDWTAEEVWDEADRAGDHSGLAQQMLTYLAERIEADERALPVNADDAFNAFRLAYYGRNKSLAPELESFRRAYAAITHPPAQPVQTVDVEAVREVIATLDCVGSAGSDHYSSEYLQDAINDASDKLSQAIGDKT